MSYNKETEMYEGYIYKITNCINGKIYIGQTITTVKERWKNHKSEANTHKSNMIIHKAMRKYGLDNFKIIELEKISNQNKFTLKKQLNDLEIYYIGLFNSNDENFGYNITSGGDNVDHMFKPVNQYTTDGTFVKRWDSITLAADYYKISRSCIVACCVGRVKTSCGYVWRHEEDSFDKYSAVHVREKGVKKFDIDGNLLGVYDSATEASIDNNCSATSILHCCNGMSLSSCGFIWRFILDDFNKYEIPDEAKKRQKSVKMYDLDGNLLNVYSTVKEAGMINNCNPSGIIRSCKGQRYSCNGKVWRYIEDNFDKYDK